MATETVTVACKLPNGLKCRLFAPVQETESVVGGGTRDVTRHYPTGEQFVLNGTASRVGELPKARLASGAPGAASAEVTDTGYALTFGVPKDLWDRWHEANRHNDYVRNGLVFAHKQQASVKKQAKDHEALRSGLEPVDPENPAPGIEPTDDQKKRLVGERLKTA